MKQKDLLILRYVVLLFQLFLHFHLGNVDSTTYFIWALFLVILNQSRLFLFRSHLIPFAIVAVMEVVLLFMTHYETFPYFGLLFIPVIMDCILYTDTKIFAYIGSAIFLALSILPGDFSSSHLLSLFLMLIMIILTFYLRISKTRELEQETEILKLRDTLHEQSLQSRINEVEQQNRDELLLIRERNRISRDIHDSVGHSLSTIIIQLAAMEKLSTKDPEKTAEMAQILGSFSKDSLEKIRTALRELKPGSYSAYGLLLQIDELCKKTEKLSGIKISFRHSGNVQKIHEDLNNHLLFITQEFLANAVRHGKASNANLHLHFRESELVYNLGDNGIGCSEKPIYGIGLRSAEERVEELKGQMQIRTAEGEGFHMKLVLPLEQETLYE